MTKFLILIPLMVASFLTSSVTLADENRYQAHWNGQSYLIVDSDGGHLWTLRKDSMVYIGAVDDGQFIPPKIPQIWQNLHGKWSKTN